MTLACQKFGPLHSACSATASRRRTSDCLGHDLQGQARQPDHAALARAGQACPIADVVGVHPACSWSPASKSLMARVNTRPPAAFSASRSASSVGPATGLPIPAACGNRLRGLRPTGRPRRRRSARRMDRLLAGGKKREPAIRVENFWHRNDPGCTAPCPAYRRTTTRSIAAPRARRRIEESRRPASRRSRACSSAEAGGSRLWLTVAKGADVRRPLQAGRPDRFAVPCGRLCEPLGDRGGRRHRSPPT